MVTLDQANAGRAIQGRSPWTQDELDAQVKRQAAARQGKPADTPDQPPAPARTTRPSRSGSGADVPGPVDAAKTISGATTGILRGKTPATLSAGVLGIIGYALLDNFIAGGWGQVKGWFAAKFLNKPYAGASASSSTTPGSATATPGAITGVPNVLVPTSIFPTAATSSLSPPTGVLT